MNDHHLILGHLKDYITGRIITDTHDERYRQKIAHMLVDEKGYQKSEITPQYPLTIKVDDKCALVPVTFTVSLNGKAAMIVHYGPGSLVTRHRPALAMSRLVAEYQIPIAVVSNGEDAHVLDGQTGKIRGEGLLAIPKKAELAGEFRTSGHPTNGPKISALRRQGEARILMAFEVDDRCPCDDTTCLLAGQ
jgi:hypothetical protein